MFTDERTIWSRAGIMYRHRTESELEGLVLPAEGLERGTREATCFPLAEDIVEKWRPGVVLKFGQILGVRVRSKMK